MTDSVLSYVRSAASDATGRLCLFVLGVLALWAGLYCAMRYVQAWRDARRRRDVETALEIVRRCQP